ncbi:siderophore-interacting protein [Tranquillimonas rosea]|uniref:siderophore-interacting protein n=1 Tax=Tranquillimonas rosea TaxID=641238 RepID=UPI003BA95CA6
MTDLTAHGHLPTAPAPALLDEIAASILEQDLPLADHRPARVESDTGIGVIRFDAADDGLHVDIHSDSAANLYMLRESVLGRLDALRSGLGAQLEWAGELPRGATPPNFREARVVGRSRVGARFLRLRLAAPDLQDFARSGIHIRLLLPPEGRDPVWPMIGAEGRTVWPSGADALHTPAYTIRAIDPDAGWMDVDVYLHGNGPTCAWAEAATHGARVGLAGPGGGWLPEAAHLVLAGDETALPAIARILETAPPHVTGLAAIEVEDDDDVLTLTAPVGMRVRWLRRSAGDPGLEELLRSADLGVAGERHVWVAAEKRRVQAMRRFVRTEAGVDRSECYVAAYWTAQKPD